MSECRITFADDRCAGIGMCEATVPDVFAVGDDGMMELLQTRIDAGRFAELEDAAANCPMGCLSVQIAQ